MTERLNPQFAVFNQHLNDAADRALALLDEFAPSIAEDIRKIDKKGIMSIFDKPPNESTAAYVWLVTAFVNEQKPKQVRRKKKAKKKAKPSKDNGATFIHTKQEMFDLRSMLGVRMDWHEPDESEVKATMFDNKFDNAFVDESEAFVEISQGDDRYRINLALLLAWASGYDR